MFEKDIPVKEKKMVVKSNQIFISNKVFAVPEAAAEGNLKIVILKIS